MIISNNKNNITKKLDIFLNISLDSPHELKAQFQKLLSNYAEIEKILKFKKDNAIYFKLLYFNRCNIHEILYDTEKVIFIKDNIEKLSNYFYLDLLILDNLDIINYTYTKDFILKIDKHLREMKAKIVIFILSKIIIDLINNYKGSDNYNEIEEKNELLNIENNKKGIIKNNINILKDLNININENDIYTKKIDDLYIEIVIGLIKESKFENYEYTYKIMKELDILSIDITKYMFDKLKQILDDKKDYIKKYEILKIDDLFNINIINFYYILIKYILKNSFYFHQIPFLLKTRKIILHFINNSLNDIWSLKEYNNNDIIRERMDYIIEQITDSKYYFEKYMGYIILEQLKEILIYYKNFLFEKKEDILELEKIIQNKEFEKKDKYINDYKNAKLMNNLLYIVKNVFNLEKENKDLSIIKERFNEYLEEWKKIEKMIKERKYKEIRKDIIKQLINFFKDEKNKKILQNIFKEEEYKSFIEEYNNISDENIKDKSNIEESKENKNNLDDEKSDIKIKANDSINIKKPKIEESSIIIQTVSVNNSNNSNNSNILDNNKSFKKENNELNEGEGDEYNEILNINSLYSKELELFQKPSLYEIIKFIKIIGNHQMSEYIINLSHSFYLSGGTNKKLILYNKLFENVMEIKLSENLYNISEINNNDNNNEILIMACCQKELVLIIFDINNYNCKMKKYVIQNIPCTSLYQMDNKNYIICGENGVYLLDNFSFNSNQQKNKIDRIFKEYYRGGIQINKNIIALSSNNILPNGKNKIIFYNFNKKIIYKEIEGFSFNISPNGLSLINNNDHKILLCACKKYNIEQENGILLVNININNRTEKFFHSFYNTDYFEVNCFCPILDVKNNNSLDDDITKEENIKINKTNYFLVGGFDVDKGEGIIKLYEIIYSEKFNETSIKYIQDIIIPKNDNFEGFNNSISGITQSKITGNILVTCLDGNVYLFKPPNIDFYLSYLPN